MNEWISSSEIEANNRLEEMWNCECELWRGDVRSCQLVARRWAIFIAVVVVVVVVVFSFWNLLLLSLFVVFFFFFSVRRYIVLGNHRRRSVRRLHESYEGDISTRPYGTVSNVSLHHKALMDWWSTFCRRGSRWICLNKQIHTHTVKMFWLLQISRTSIHRHSTSSFIRQRRRDLQVYFGNLGGVFFSFYLFFFLVPTATENYDDRVDLFFFKYIYLYIFSFLLTQLAHVDDSVRTNWKFSQLNHTYIHAYLFDTSY